MKMTESNPSNHEYKPWTRVSLGIFSDTLTPTEIAEILDETPSRSHLKGDLVSSRSPEGPFRKENKWTITFDTDPELPFKEHLDCILDFVDEKQERFILLQDRCDSRIFCSSSVVHRCAFNLSIDDLALLARTNVRLVFDLTAPDVL